MTFRHGTGAKFYYHTLDFTDYVEEVDPAFERELAEYAPLSASWKSSLPGLRSATISLSGLYDSTADKMAATAWAVFDGTTVRPFAYLPDGDAISNVAYCGESLVSSENIPASNDVLRFPVAVIGTDHFDRCAVLHTLSEETETEAESSLDGVAASNYGCVAYLLCSAVSASDTLDVKLEHSTNNSDWDDLLTFTQLAAAGSEVKTVAAGAASVRQYVKVSWTIAGADTAMTFFVAWHRLTS